MLEPYAVLPMYTVSRVNEPLWNCLSELDLANLDMETPNHILVVDDDPKVRKLLRRCFEMEGYRVSEATDSQSVAANMANDPIDLITLDLGLGQEDGLTIARDIRASSDIPIIMLTGKGDMIDKVVGLEVGADDYIAKPFHVREVLARVRSVMRRSARQPQPQTAPAGQQSDRRFKFGEWIVDFAAFDLRAEDGNAVDLTSGEFQLLEVFVNRPNRILSRDQLMDLLKGHDWTPNDRSIDNQIARLRKKIEPKPDRPSLIKTVRGIGYSFVSEVTPV